jgi:restriction endonuclease S subunit
MASARAFSSCSELTPSASLVCAVTNGYLDERVALDDAAEYITITVKRRHGGLEERERLLGHQIQTKKQFRLVPGAFIISRVQCWHQAYAIVPDDIPPNMIASVNYDQFAVSPKVDRRFFWWLSHSPYFTDTVRSSAFGVVIEKMVFNRDAWLDKKIPLPSFEEQCRIVGRIEGLAAKINGAYELRLQSKNETNVFFAKVLARAFEPYRAAMRPIGDVFTVTTGGTPSRGNPAFWGGDVKWVSSGEVNFRIIDDTEEKITRHGVESSNAKINPPGTVLLAMIGQGKTRGQCAILGCNAANNQNVAAIHVYKTPHKPEYVYWWLYSQYQQSRSVETGTAQPALSGERVKQLQIPIAPIDEQCRIVSELNDLQNRINALKTLQSETSTELNALMPSILDKAFRGEL